MHFEVTIGVGQDYYRVHAAYAWAKLSHGHDPIATHWLQRQIKDSKGKWVMDNFGHLMPTERGLYTLTGQVHLAGGDPTYTDVRITKK